MKNNYKIVSIHIPKTGGTSVRSVLQNWFGNSFYFYRKKNIERYPLLKLILPLLLFNKKMIHGHLDAANLRILKRHISKNHIKILLLRNPLDVQISKFYQLHRRLEKKLYISKANKKELEFISDIDTYISNTSSNILRYLPENLNSINYKQVIDSEYEIVGVLDYLQEYVDKLAEILNKPKQNVPWKLQTSNKKQPSDQTISNFTDRHSLEYEVYNYILSKYKK
ncbi:MAG: sulfotransferase family 2 domain-containing protein [Bacteroidales bacterium]|nr:sulfotransferase family 2 domain-containing protein [Bacteroidales bacterium]